MESIFTILICKISIFFET